MPTAVHGPQANATLARASRAPFARHLRKFLRQEDGAMAPYIIVLMFLMLVFGGFAVDVMRFETRRVAVQNTLDRATLAAASLTQALDPRDVVADYFEKANLLDELKSVTVTRGMNFRIVEATAGVESQNYFMHLVGLDSLGATSLSRAEQRISNVEIALVLDVSGSMWETQSRIKNLRTAVKSFIDTVLKDDDENKISLTIVPYNGHVNLGPTLMNKFNVSNRHTYANSYCLDLPQNNNVFTQTEISRQTPLSQVPMADSYSTSSAYSATGQNATATTWRAKEGLTYNQDRKLYSNVWCAPYAQNYVRLYQNNAQVLKDNIDALVPIGATSINLGMKWATALLDPNSQSIVSELVNENQIPSYFNGRPAAYDDEETLKVIILMTDGEHWPFEYINPQYRTGTSPIYQANSGQAYSIFHSSKLNSSTQTTICNSRPYWVPHLSEWHARPWNGTAPGSKECYDGKATGATQLTWDVVGQAVRQHWTAWQLYARAFGTSASDVNTRLTSTRNSFRTVTPITTMDDQLHLICSSAKNKGILIYGIAFEAPANGARVIRDCVTDPSQHFFDVQGLEISTSFAHIASNLSMLRLTQ